MKLKMKRLQFSLSLAMATAILLFPLCAESQDTHITFQDTDVNHSAMRVNDSLRDVQIIGVSGSEKTVAFQDLLQDSGTFNLDCSKTGDGETGQSVCYRRYVSGASATIIKDYEWHGHEYKIQVRAAAFDAAKTPGNKRTLRQKVDYAPDRKTKLKEFLDIVNRPLQGKITREIIIYEYDPETQKVKSVSWTHYKQLGTTSFAGLEYYATLSYDREGKPLMINAERWREGKKVESLLNWDRTNPLSSFDPDLWQQWQDKIYTASQREAFL